MTKIIHVSDIHIRNSKFHSEYEHVFNQLFEHVEREKPDFVVMTGDLAHTKTNLSPEYFDLARWFYARLLESFDGKVVSILGNHDFSLSNKTRLDAISPVITSFEDEERERLPFLRKSGEMVFGDVCFNCLSILDEKNWIKPTDESKINIALFHGPVQGSKTDIGWEMENERYTTAMFDEFDYAFLGDIHKANQSMDREGKIRYPGSLVQQNFGEDLVKGYLLWTIHDKERYECKFVGLDNPKPFVTVQIDADKSFDESELKPGCKIRIISPHHQSYELDEMKEDLKTRFKPSILIHPNKASTDHVGEDPLLQEAQTDLRNIGVQESLIKSFLKDQKINDDLMEEILRINKETTNTILGQEDVQRNSHWNVKSLEWYNLFKYGKDNKINFNNLRGIVGIFGKNRSGKSSVVDALLLTLFGTYSKPSRQLINAINMRETLAAGRVVLDIDGKEHVITRRLLKNGGKAKSELKFSSEDAQLEGTSRKDTDKIIQRRLGSYDDFKSTAMASQFDFLNFVNEGGTKRKQILGRFLDLDLFERKFKIAHEESKFLKQSLAKIKELDFNEEIKHAQLEHKCEVESIKALQDRLVVNEAVGESVRGLIEGLEREISMHNVLPFELHQLKQQAKQLETRYQSSMERLATEETTLGKRRDNLRKASSFRSSNKKRYMISKQVLVEIEEIKREIRKNEQEISVLERKLKNDESKMNFFENKPCGSQFPGCLFIQDAQRVLDGYFAESKAEREALMMRNEELAALLERHDHNSIERFCQNYEESLRAIENEEHEIEKAELKIVSLQNSIKSILEKQAEVRSNTDECIKNEEEMKFVEEKRQQVRKHKRNLSQNLNEKEKLQRQLMDAQLQKGKLEQKIQHLQQQKQDVKEMKKKYAAYDLFKKCVHSNGIPFSIIKQKLGVINREIKRCIEDVYDFEVFFRDEGKNLNIFLRDEEGNELLLDAMCSGSEKMIASMAIRLALTNISSLPKPDVFILDEPATALDSELLQNFSKLLLMLKNNFKCVMMISHMEALKDACDMIIEIENNDGYARVNA